MTSISNVRFFATAILFSTLCFNIAAPNAFAGHWTVIATSSNSTAVEPASGQMIKISSSIGLSTMAAIHTEGYYVGTSPMPRTLSDEAVGYYSGTATANWIPDSATDWPADCTITHSHSEVYTSRLKDVTANSATASKWLSSSFSDQAKVYVGLSGLIGTVATVTPSSSISGDPNSSYYQIITTVGKSKSSPLDGGTSSMLFTGTIIQHKIKQSYFTSTFTTPSEVSIPITIAETKVKVASSYSSTSTTGSSLVSAAASDFVQVTVD